ncbi:outer membrane protein assembly factor BamE [Alkalimonas amylolytica]|nr:outer membrane protein assembly factor BamE [Alkalimonas amylolytica]
MKSMNVVAKWLIILSSVITLSACSSWIYRIDIPQGNYMEQRDIDKLRVQMSKEQVRFVLGNPVAQNSFDDNVWHYYYAIQYGNGNKMERSLVVHFDNGRLAKVEGDFELSEEFDTPLDN